MFALSRVYIHIAKLVILKTLLMTSVQPAWAFRLNLRRRGYSGCDPAANAEPHPEPTATRFVIVTPIVEDAASPTDTAVQPGDPAPPEIVATAEAIYGEGGVYVANLPRPGDVPSGWLMDRSPHYQARTPEPGETYRFACRDLPARSTGVATVGYRSLEGLPSVSIEYVLYPSDEAAEAALADMGEAAETCGEFGAQLSGLTGGVQARITPVDYPAFGEGTFAAVLETDSEATGPLVTQVIKIRQGNVVAGINHVVSAGEAEPDPVVGEALSELVVTYLSGIE
ncbi:MAG: hypothetical protein R3C44_14515 [Chloroflexota bacterium]